MKGVELIISGDWAHFKRPETSNNPLTHDLMPKTAFIGLIGAVLGIDRKEMKSKFPQFSEDFLYNVALLHPLKKVSWGFTSRKAHNPSISGSPKYFEFLKNPKFLIVLALKANRSKFFFENFVNAIKANESIYNPVLGWHNCPATIEFVSEGNFSKQIIGDFTTKFFVKSTGYTLKVDRGNFRIGLDKLPTHQNNDFWNNPKYYEKIIYPDFPNTLSLSGLHYDYFRDTGKTEQCWLM